nr:5-deoxy-glucuronate isomerase [Streptomyces sp. ODS05-4]
MPDGTAAGDGYRCRIDPRSAGWEFSSLRILDLPPAGRRRLETGDSEWIVLPLAGSLSVSCDGGRCELTGRDDVFSAVSDFAYLPRDTEAELRSPAGGRFALVGARCENRLPFRYGPASGVPVEVRGAGRASRQVNNFAAAGVFETDRLIAVEVLTPAGNWSSYPPHKHDEDRPGEESKLEEIYWFSVGDGAYGGPGGGYHRVAPSHPDGARETVAHVGTGDAVLVPDGWHGPSIAPPEQHLYYLNVMAGPGVERAWLICDDPAHAWVRGAWAGEAPDPRLPFSTAPSRPKDTR